MAVNYVGYGHCRWCFERLQCYMLGLPVHRHVGNAQYHKGPIALMPGKTIFAVAGCARGFRAGLVQNLHCLDFGHLDGVRRYATAYRHGRGICSGKQPSSGLAIRHRCSENRFLSILFPDY